MKDWKKLLVRENITVRDVVQVISEGRCQIALVVDADKKLIGTVTDGDIRRGLLRGVDFAGKVNEIMNASFIKASAADDRSSILEMMRRNSIHQVPVLKLDDTLEGLYLLDDLINPERRENPVLLMAGGLGTRLKPLTDNTPKPMLNVGGKPMLETILEGFIAQGFYRFYISVNYLAHVIENYFGDGSKWGVQISYVREKDRLGTGGALGLIPDAIESPLLMINGDVLTKIDYIGLLKFHTENKAAATMGVRPYQITVPYGVVSVDDNYVSEFKEKPVISYYINAGIYVVEPVVLEMIEKNVHVDMPDLLAKVRNDNQPVAAFPIHEYWLDMGHHDEFARANLEFDHSFQND